MAGRIDDRHLSGVATWSKDVALLVESEYDLILMGASWDVRCLSITATRVRARQVIVVLPSNRGSGGLRSQHDQAILQWAGAMTSDVKVIEGETEDVGDLFDRVWNPIWKLYLELKRPLRILVDLSATVRFITLGTISLALADGIAESVDVFYAEGEYGDIVSFRETAPKMEGAWEAVAIPGLEGDWFPDRKRHFLISVGFNADKAARLAERWDPNKVSVLFPKPGLKAEYETATEEANGPWMTRLGVSIEDRIDASPADVVEAWRSLVVSPALADGGENVYGLLCGSKTHGLAITLWSLARRSPAVLYVRPTTHVEQKILPNGKFWMFRVWDRTLVTSALGRN